MKSVLKELLNRALKGDWQGKRVVVSVNDRLLGLLDIQLTQTTKLEHNFLIISNNPIPLHRIKKLVVDGELVYEKTQNQ